MISTVTKKLLAMSMLKGVGPVTLRKAFELADFETETVERLATKIPTLQKAITLPDAWTNAIVLSEQQIDAATRHEARIMSPADAAYPSLLSRSKNDPFILYVRGSLAKQPLKSVAIIGTRKPTRHGSIITERITRFFSEQGWSVVSGLALGCDGIAHQTAVDKKGHTIAVLAHGLQTVMPGKHTALAENILESGGALVSQYPFGREAIPQQFAQRDKTQAGLAQGVVMIQSDLKGGSLIASRAALDTGRWLAVPSPTKEDLTSNELKIQANLVLCDDHIDEKLKLLKTKEKNLLSRIIVLYSKNDYKSCLTKSTF